MSYFFYVKGSNETTFQDIGLPAGYRAEIWKPKKFRFTPHGLKSLKGLFLFWWLMDRCRLFRNRNYRVYLVYFRDTVAHYSVVLPPFFRVPFMRENDLQIGPVATHQDHRRKGLALFAMNQIVAAFRLRTREFWYITKSNNIASIKACEKAGFVRHAIGVRKPRLGLSLLARFELQQLTRRKSDALIRA